MELKVGDKVKVVKAVDGKGFAWISCMDSTLGKTFTIKQMRRGYLGETEVLLDGTLSALYTPESLELVSNKFIDGVAVSDEEFTRRTTAPVKMSLKEIEERLGFLIELK